MYAHVLTLKSRTSDLLVLCFKENMDVEKHGTRIEVSSILYLAVLWGRKCQKSTAKENYLPVHIIKVIQMNALVQLDSLYATHTYGTI